MPDPIYTSQNCEAAYQLDWSYSLFWHRTPPDFSWFDTLKELNESDNIRLLQHQFDRPNVSKFLISTQPQAAPRTIVQRAKGRLQHLIRQPMPNAFRRNYSLRSIGSTRREKLQQYLATQVAHHPMADPRVADRLHRYQIHRAEVDLSQPRKNNYAIYWYNLHVVVVNDGRWMEIRDDRLQSVHDMILNVADAKDHWLSRAAILPDHIHMTLGCRLEQSPQEVVLAYMNNLAFALGMKPVFRYSYYVGTFSEYDLRVIPRR